LRCNSLRGFESLPLRQFAADLNGWDSVGRSAVDIEFVKNVGLIITIVIVGVVFGFLWSQGYLVKIRNYVAETQEELRKCTWPTWDELKGSTLLVMVTMALLGLFTISVDFVLSLVNRVIH
jgi:preprotein translocase subunit SecE